MPLGFLAKDSIQDLEILARESAQQERPHDEESTGEEPVIGEQVSQPLAPVQGPPVVPLEEAVAHDTSVESHEHDDDEASQTAANPQQAQEEEQQQEHEGARRASTSYGQYSGFRADYFLSQHPKSTAAVDTHLDSGNYFFHDTYAPVIVGRGQEQKFFPKLISCLFPWMAHHESNEQKRPSFQSETYEQETVDHSTITGNTPTTTTTTTSTTVRRNEDDENSSSSDKMGEKLSAKERNAVLARLGLAQPETTNADAVSSKEGLLNGIPTYDTSPLQIDLNEPKNPKSILKKRSKSKLDLKSQPQSQGRKNDEQGRRRSLFPSYETLQKSSAKKNARFAPMARVVTVKSKNDMLAEEKADIWWQKTDYEEFRKTGRIITRAMLEGGSEIWLTQTSSSDSGNFSSPNAGGSLPTTRDKWWHKFGHSRRGLEHVVSMEEGRERQINVRHAIRAVVEEQARQKMYHREDAEKLRKVSLMHTSWARDLSLASGASDADAVKSSFAPDRKSREFYLLKMARKDPKALSSRHVPDFMQPFKHTSPVVPAARKTHMQQHRLDANTAAQISFRRRQTKSVAPAPAAVAESSEPIKDPNPEDKTSESLAHRAAGFSSEGEKVDMAAVLSGMGAIPQEASPTTVAS